ncbi:MAG: exodeoxyribonuclease III [Opitutales bacterium]|nr:exodeoxyribonuclease III [Opitutales bacterium]
MRILSWNVNGLRAVQKKGFAAFVRDCGADHVCLQEVKAKAAQVTGDWPDDFAPVWNPAERAGYSGTLVLARREPLEVSLGIGEPTGDAEGRVITCTYNDFHLVNVYTPNVRGDLSRLDFRTNVWDPAFREHCVRLDAAKPVVICGDLNVAHREIDLARPAANRGNAGFTDEERAAFQEHLDAGFLDSFRAFEPGPGHYSWWSYRGGARARNVGWRIDYVLVSNRLKKRLRAAFIRPEVAGSDHCPVGIDLESG